MGKLLDRWAFVRSLVNRVLGRRSFGRNNSSIKLGVNELYARLNDFYLSFWYALRRMILSYTAHLFSQPHTS